MPALNPFSTPLPFLGRFGEVWPVHADSARGQVKFQPVTRKQAYEIWNRAHEWERDSRQPGARGGIIGFVGMRVLDALLWHFLDRKTGRLDPSYETIARIAAVGRSAVADALQRLKKLGLIHWVRRCSERFIGGRFTLEQDTNAYGILPPSQWRLFTPRHTDPPPPQPGTWGDHPPLPDLITQAQDDRRNGGSTQAALAVLELDPAGDPVTAAIARLFRAVDAAENQQITGVRTAD
jgi:hypothetical protein